MKIKALMLTAVLALGMGCMKEKVNLENQEHLQSYAIGQSIGQGFKAQGLNINVSVLSQSIEDAIKGESQLSEEKLREAIESIQKESIAKQQQEFEVESSKNEEVGTAFLEANKSKSGVKVTSSGLQYKVINKGTGKVKPKPSDTVEVHYKGTLIDGTEFDSSYKRNQTATFRLDQVIKGWTEGLQLMTEGAEYELYIPSELAYGERGAGPVIGPNSTLIFNVKLVDIK